MIIAIDYGRKRVGVAISEGLQAQTLTALHRNEVVSWLKHFAQTHAVKQIILGIPQGYMVDEIKTFGTMLESTLRLPVVYWDETLSSHYAQEHLIKFGSSKKTRADQDAHAAAFVLQSYLDDQKP